MAFSSKDIREYHRQSTHRKATGNTKKYSCLPLVMMAESIGRFSDEDTNRLATAARLPSGMVRVRKASA